MTKRGIKHDSGKPRVSLVFTDFHSALLSVAEVGTFGAAKYTDHGWVDVPNAPGRYRDAMLRHTLAELGGEELDAESGLSHLAHAAWNALAILQLELNKTKNQK